MVLVGGVLGDQQEGAVGIGLRGFGVCRFGLGRLLEPEEDGVAVGEASGVRGVGGEEPVKAGAAAVHAAEDGAAHAVVFLGRDDVVLAVGEGGDHALVDPLVMLVGVGEVLQLGVDEGDGGLVGVDLLRGDGDLVVEHIVPVAGVRVVEGVGGVDDDVGEGAALRHLDGELLDPRSVGLHAPGPGGGEAALALDRGGQKLEPAVVVEIGDRVGPAGIRVVLPETAELGEDELDLLVRALGDLDGGCFGGRGGSGRRRGGGLVREGGPAACAAESHHQREKQSGQFFHGDSPYYKIGSLSAPSGPRGGEGRDFLPISLHKL